MKLILIIAAATVMAITAAIAIPRIVEAVDCQCDINYSGSHNSIDIAIVRSHFPSGGDLGDVTGDHDTDSIDIALVRAAFGTPSCTVNPVYGTGSASLDSEEQAFLVLVNNHRAANSLGPVVEHSIISQSTQWKSDGMYKMGSPLVHNDPDRTWVQRLDDCGWETNNWLGDIIAGGDTLDTAQEAFNIFANSPSHNGIMLGSAYTHIGIGRHCGPPKEPLFDCLWTAEFSSNLSGMSGPMIAEATPLEAPTCTITHDEEVGAHLIDGATWPQGSVMVVTTASDDPSYSYTATTSIYPWGQLFSAIDDVFLSVGGEYYTDVGFDTNANSELDGTESVCQMEFEYP